MLAAVIVLGGTGLGFGAGSVAVRSKDSRPQEASSVSGLLGQKFFTTEAGRRIVRASQTQPVVLYLFSWSECLVCSADLVSWHESALRFPSIASFAVMTRKLAPSMTDFVSGLGVSLEVASDSLNSIVSQNAQLPQLLLIADGRALVSAHGKYAESQFWLAVAESLKVQPLPRRAERRRS
jgi:hypothetical protein